ncbi:MAG TPA: CPBP family intramembrane metalloprotease [Dehalococcoidia bacterium]|jgi:membrane protease YdiL (CAAX protease family)|nr:CPBP family intramembrane metalloprotease [Dehalococcoidia bacterium]
MSAKQIIAIIIPPILIAFMYPVFHLLAGALALERLAWYLGLIIYWLVWGAAFPLLVIGKENIRALIRPQRADKKVLLLVAIPLLLAIVGRLIPGMAYQKESVWIFLLLLSTACGNGFFEEVLWRGVYLKLFPDNIFYRMIWPSVWFALWHYAPGSVLGDEVAGLMIGAGLFGLYLSYLAKKTNTLWWPMITHFLSGIIMVV